MMKHRGMYVGALICAVFMFTLIGCGKGQYRSAFVAESITPIELTKVKYRTLKTGAVGESSGFKLIWIPFLSPTEGAAKLDMLNSVNKEGIQTAGKNIGFTNATYDREMRGLLGLIGFPAIVLRADVIEVLEVQRPTEESSPQN